MHQIIKQKLIEKRISQQTAADTVGMSRISLNRYLNGKTELGATNFVKLLAVVGLYVVPGYNEAHHVLSNIRGPN
jgi:transcriptional regulator with XRE-family HTH domain